MAAFYERVDAGLVNLKKKTLNSLASEEGRNIFSRNMQLMDLAAAPRLTGSGVSVTNQAVDPVVFCDWAEHYSFSAILRNIGEFIAPFEAACNRPGLTEFLTAAASLGSEVSNAAMM